MAQQVKLKRSAVPAKVPLTSDLELGELAVNTYDGKLYLKKDDGTESVVEIGAGSGDVIGPNGVSTTSVALFDGPSGKVLQDSRILVASTPDEVLVTSGHVPATPATVYNRVQIEKDAASISVTGETADVSFKDFAWSRPSANQNNAYAGSGINQLQTAVASNGTEATSGFSAGGNAYSSDSTSSASSAGCTQGFTRADGSYASTGQKLNGYLTALEPYSAASRLELWYGDYDVNETPISSNSLSLLSGWSGLAVEAWGAPLDFQIEGNQTLALTSFGEIALGESRNPGTSGQVLTSQGVGQPTVWADLPAGGSGDVVGPATSTDGAFAVYADTTGKLIRQSALTEQYVSIPGVSETTSIGVDSTAAEGQSREVNTYHNAEYISPDGSQLSPSVFQISRTSPAGTTGGRSFASSRIDATGYLPSGKQFSSYVEQILSGYSQDGNANLTAVNRTRQFANLLGDAYAESNVSTHLTFLSGYAVGDVNGHSAVHKVACSRYDENEDTIYNNEAATVVDPSGIYQKYYGAPLVFEFEGIPAYSLNGAGQIGLGPTLAVGNIGQVLTSGGAGQPAWWADPVAAGGSGDVVGPAASVPNAIPTFADTSGKLLGASEATIVSGRLTGTDEGIANYDTYTFTSAAVPSGVEGRSEVRHGFGPPVYDDGAGTTLQAASTEREYTVSAGTTRNAYAEREMFTEYLATDFENWGGTYSDASSANTGAHGTIRVYSGFYFPGTEIEYFGSAEALTNSWSGGTETSFIARYGAVDYLNGTIADQYSLGIFVNRNGASLVSTGAPVDVVVDGTRVASFTAFGELTTGASRNPGTAGQVLTSQGPGQPTVWATPSGGGGSGDMLQATYDTNGDGKVNAADTADAVPWAGVTGKPTTFAPEAHTHTISEVTGLQTALDGKQPAGSYEPAITKAAGYAKWNGSAWVFVDETYLQSFTETDPVFSASAAAGISGAQITNWDAAFGWGNHASAGYLQSFTETDPVFTASAAAGITGTQITNWGTAYGWGNHATAGYLSASTASTTYQPLSANLTSWAGIAPSQKADAIHSHGIADVTGLQSALDAKQSTITVSATAPASPTVGQLWLDTSGA